MSAVCRTDYNVWQSGVPGSAGQGREWGHHDSIQELAGQRIGEAGQRKGVSRTEYRGQQDGGQQSAGQYIQVQ